MSTAEDAAAAKIAEVRNFSLTIEADEIDATSHDSSGDDESIMGKLSWSGTAEALHVQDNAGQQALTDVLLGRTLVDFEFYPGGEGTGWLFGSGFVDEWELGSPLGDAAAVSLAFVGDGLLEMWQGPYYPKVTAGLFVLDSTDTGLRFDVSGGLFTVASSGGFVAVIRRGASTQAGLFALTAE